MSILGKEPIAADFVHLLADEGVQEARAANLQEVAAALERQGGSGGRPAREQLWLAAKGNPTLRHNLTRVFVASFVIVIDDDNAGHGSFRVDGTASAPLFQPMPIHVIQAVQEALLQRLVASRSIRAFSEAQVHAAEEVFVTAATSAHNVQADMTSIEVRAWLWKEAEGDRELMDAFVRLAILSLPLDADADGRELMSRDVPPAAPFRLN